MKGLIFLALTGAFLHSIEAASPFYSVTQIGSPNFLSTLKSVTPVAINAAGEVTGTAGLPQSSNIFTFSNGTFTLLNVPGTHDTGSIATGLNDVGQIVGVEVGAQPTGFGFIDTQGSLTLIPGSFRTTGINTTPVVSGSLLIAHGNSHAALYTSSGTADLGTFGGFNSIANAINNNGQVVGAASLAGDTVTHAFLYNGAGLIDLGTLGGQNSAATAVSSSGDVAGVSGTTVNSVSHAFLYSAGAMQDLGALTGYPSSYATGVNRDRQVVGHSDAQVDQTTTVSRAFVYRDGAMQDLNGLIPSGSGWVLSNATAINDAGQIVGTGTLNGQFGEGFLLTPVTAPITCQVSATADPLEALSLTVQAGVAGLKSVEVVDTSNASVTIPPFSVGMTSPLIATAQTIHTKRASSVSLEITDTARHSLTCNAANYIAEVGHRKETHAFRQLSASEYFVKITNGSPGLTAIILTVNGKAFSVPDLSDGQAVSLNVKDAMVQGDHNFVVIETSGPAGATALILITDAPLQ